ncbi:MAG TPA: 4-hydroxy-3-methylbut-2-en-1-yl diphosphate synthase, partial [Chromatiales bacterium]|nr:4-hydroxy-3-methylbut-2-en-1-yl diphosphate synthase [Chromatiales bacterium]
VGWDILKSLKLRSRGVNLIACPSCARQEFDVIKTVNALEERIEDIDTSMDVAVIGCVVNGPGEAREAAVGLTGGKPNLLYVDGKPSRKLSEDALVDQIEQTIRERVAREKAAHEAAHDSSDDR